MAEALINGESYSWVKITFGILDNPIVVGVTAINYKRTQGYVNNKAAGMEPSSRGPQAAEYTCGISLEEVEVRRILKAARAKGIKTLTTIPPFTVTVSYRRGSVKSVDKVYNWQFTEDGIDAKEGDTNIVRAIPSICAGIDFGLEG